MVRAKELIKMLLKVEELDTSAFDVISPDLSAVLTIPVVYSARKPEDVTRNWLMFIKSEDASEILQDLIQSIIDVGDSRQN